MPASSLLPALLTAWATVAAGFSAVTLVRVLRRRPAAAGTGEGPLPPVLLLRPLDAPTPGELACLAAPLDYAGPLEHVVLSPFRPRLPPHVRWLPSDPLTPNRKVGHLAYALSALACAGRVVVAVDADVAVTGALVRALAVPVARGAALATAAPCPLPGGSLASEAVRGLLGHTHHSFVALDAMRAGAAAICGKALGLSPAACAVLAGLGGHLGEDLELAVRLHAVGAPVVLADVPAHLPPRGHLTPGEALARFTRWMQVLRAHRPRLYPTVPLLLAPSLPLLALSLLSGHPAPSLAALALLGVRTGLALALGRRAGTGGAGTGLADAWLWLPGEALLLAAFLRSLPARTVRWRGRTFTLGRGGAMLPAQPAAGVPR